MRTDGSARAVRGGAASEWKKRETRERGTTDVSGRCCFQPAAGTGRRGSANDWPAILGTDAINIPQDHARAVIGRSSWMWSWLAPATVTARRCTQRTICSLPDGSGGEWRGVKRPTSSVYIRRWTDTHKGHVCLNTFLFRRTFGMFCGSYIPRGFILSSCGINASREHSVIVAAGVWGRRIGICRTTSG